jgi:hypothetical protein
MTWRSSSLPGGFGRVTEQLPDRNMCGATILGLRSTCFEAR